MVTKKKASKTSPTSKPAALASQAVPSAATLFRMKNLDESTRVQIRKATSKLKPLLWIRDGPSVERIQRAQSLDDVLDLASEVAGLAEDAWFDRMREFGSEALPQISRRLRAARSGGDQNSRDKLTELLVAELRWRGLAGANVLLECFDALDDYGRCLACAALGLTGVPEGASQEAADKIWRFYERTVPDRKNNFFAGALWGLAGLGDPRLSRALVDRLQHKNYFYELFGFLSLAGDAAAVFPLLREAVERQPEEKSEAIMALVSIAHRIGREALIAGLAQGAPEGEPPEELAKMADHILSLPASTAHEHFSLFYRGISPQDVSEVFGAISLGEISLE